MDDVHNEQKSVKERSSLLIVPIDVVFDHERNLSFTFSNGNIHNSSLLLPVFSARYNYTTSYSFIEELVHLSLIEDF